MNNDTRDGTTSGHTVGGSLIVNYDFNENYSLAARGEYVKETGGANLLALSTGQAPKAWTLTVTPTYRNKSFFARADLSYVKVSDSKPFGPTTNEDTQARAVGEVGFLF